MPEYTPIPRALDPDHPSGARVHDFLLGGGSNFASDRRLAREVLAVAPDMRLNTVADRACLHRVVRMCLEQGVRQFLDLSCGILTIGPAHEVAQQTDPDARVVYVSREPVAVTHGELLLESNPNTEIVQADPRDAEQVLATDGVRRLLDFSEPVAVLMFTLLHRIPDRDEPAALIRTYLDALAPGSFLALSHLTADYAPEAMRTVCGLLENDRIPGTTRSKAEMESLLGGFDLIEPGVVPVAEWRPDHTDSDVQPPTPLVYAAVARSRTAATAPG